MIKPWILTGIAPNLEPDDVWLARRELSQSSKWQQGVDVSSLEETISARVGAMHAIAFESGRSALAATLTACGIGAGDEVLLQAFTCVVVPNAIRWAGATPVFVDCDAETFNLSVTDLEQKITPKTKAIIFQHTFGNPSGIRTVTALAEKRGLTLIEDAAHILGGTHEGKAIGTFGRVAIFSFGRDKPISSVFGGMAVTNDPTIGAALRNIQTRLPSASRLWTWRQLLHGPILSAAKRHYGGLFGRVLLGIARTLHLISLAVTAAEKQGMKPSWAGRQMSPALARLALHQFDKLDRYNQHRRDMERAYRSALPDAVIQRIDDHTDAPLLRLTVLMDDAGKIRAAAKQARIVLGNWYDHAIIPRGTDLAAIGYTPGSCPVAESLATRAINLPTDIHVSVNDIPRIVLALRTS